MGKLLDDYMRENVFQLENIVLGPGAKAGPGQKQPGPGNVTTFPEPQRPPPQPITPIDAGGAPSGPPQPAFPQEQAAPPPQGAAPMSAMGPPSPIQAAFDPPPAGGGKPPGLPDPNMEDGENSFMGLAKKTDPKEIDKALDVLEEQGVDIDEQYEKVAGQPADKGMSRKEKGLILLEFGLNLMAQSGTGTGTLGGDIGMAGIAAFKGHRGRKEAEETKLIEAEDRKVDRRLKEAQIKKAEAGNTVVKTDSDGNLVVINKDTQEAKPILMDGEPVKGDDQEMYATQVDRLAYEGEYCSGLEGAALTACKRRALAYAKGVREVAFPQVLRADQTDRVMKELEDPDNASVKFEVGGSLKRWKQMTSKEKEEVAKRLVDRRISVINSGEVTTPNAEKKKGGVTAEQVMSGVSEEDRSKMVSGKVYTMKDRDSGETHRIRIRDGKPELVD